jgi:hypothetical protein
MVAADARSAQIVNLIRCVLCAAWATVIARLVVKRMRSSGVPSWPRRRYLDYQQRKGRAQEEEEEEEEGCSWCNTWLTAF